MKILLMILIISSGISSLASEDKDCGKQLLSPYNTQNVIFLEKSLQKSRAQLNSSTTTDSPQVAELFTFQADHNQVLTEKFKAREAFAKIVNSLFEFDQNSSHRHSFTQNIRMNLSTYSEFIRHNPILFTHFQVIRQSLARLRQMPHPSQQKYIQESGGSYFFGIDDFLEDYFKKLDLMMTFDRYDRAKIFDKKLELPSTLVGLERPDPKQMIQPFLELNIYLALNLAKERHNLSMTQMSFIAAYIIDEQLVESFSIYLDLINWNSESTTLTLINSDDHQYLIKLTMDYHMSALLAVSDARKKSIFDQLIKMTSIMTLSPQDSMNTLDDLNSRVRGSSRTLPPLPDL